MNNKLILVYKEMILHPHKYPNNCNTCQYLLDKMNGLELFQYYSMYVLYLIYVQKKKNVNIKCVTNNM